MLPHVMKPLRIQPVSGLQSDRPVLTGPPGPSSRTLREEGRGPRVAGLAALGGFEGGFG